MQQIKKYLFKKQIWALQISLSDESFSRAKTTQFVFPTSFVVSRFTALRV